LLASTNDAVLGQTQVSVVSSKMYVSGQQANPEATCSWSTSLVCERATSRRAIKSVLDCIRYE